MTYRSDGLLVFDERGRIVHAGAASRRWARARWVGGSPRAVVAAAFWDPHVHLPQLPIAGRYHESLECWLERRAFPAELRHAGRAVAREGSEAFCAALVAAGTAGAGVFTAPFAHGPALALEAARRWGVAMRAGAPLIEHGAPAALCHCGPWWMRRLEQADEEFGARAAVVPRYALSCTEALLRRVGAWVRGRRRWVLTHIAETREEVRQAARRFGARSIARLFDDCGLLTPRTLLAHGVWLEQSELELLRRRRSWIVHCPTSNTALGSGRMRLEALREAGVRWALASDVGAGPRLSLLDVMREALEVHRGHARLDPAEAYYRATLAGAEALGFGRGRGALEPGRRADCIVVEGGGIRARSAAGVIREWIERGGGELWLAGRATAGVSPGMRQRLPHPRASAPDLPRR